MQDGFLRVAAATPRIQVADVRGNCDQILSLIRQAAQKDASLIIFPELSLTGYTCADLFLSLALQKAARAALHDLVKATAKWDIVCAVGLPWTMGSALYNATAVFQRGRLLGLVPKTHRSDDASFYESRYFAGGGQISSTCTIGDGVVPFGTDLLFTCREMPDFCLAFEMGEEMRALTSPSVEAALAGATVIGNLSAQNETVDMEACRRLWVKSRSASLICAYLCAEAGDGESTTDLVFSGHNLIYENGQKLIESDLFSTGLILAEIDVQLLSAERKRKTIWAVSQEPKRSYRSIEFSIQKHQTELTRHVSSQPFVAEEEAKRAAQCEKVLLLQAQGLKKRLEHTGAKHAVIGLSGGLDSTLALLVTARAFDALNLDRQNILTVIMPGFGTTDRTYQNALALARFYQTSLLEIPIHDAVLQHFKDIGHDPHCTDVTYENAQARERTQILMDLANKVKGLVVGTGDLSELALGFTTYNADHMSMYGVNSSVPKTLIRHLIRYAAGSCDPKQKEVLLDIAQTPISPELLPSDHGEITQSTEHLIGPYDLHDFFLYYWVRHGFTPSKILRLATSAFAGRYEPCVIRQWLIVFLKRFFSQQFKRSCMPDGPKVSCISLSPRGDWHMPSDAVVKVWIKELEEADQQQELKY
ncbi:MAG: NAD(+) synthase [Clostridia bacterium]|nr:NAD(+) synthase [Clostridia bacterium]